MGAPPVSSAAKPRQKLSLVTRSPHTAMVPYLIQCAQCTRTHMHLCAHTHVIVPLCERGHTHTERSSDLTSSSRPLDRRTHRPPRPAPNRCTHRPPRPAPARPVIRRDPAPARPGQDRPDRRTHRPPTSAPNRPAGQKPPRPARPDQRPSRPSHKWQLAVQLP